MKFNVIAQAFNPDTGLPLANSRAELIDTGTNELFLHCKTVYDVKMAYEAFWNNLNGYPNDGELIFVQSVTPIKS